ncbi:MAG: RagB/SusD family nutrient uptake outer membrane protein [Butyricimonas faecihominis]
MTYVDFVVQLSADYGYTRVLRTEEMYLILAEAYAHKTDGVATAVGYLNTLRETKFRTEDFETTGRAEDFTQQTLLETVWKERRREFCFEEQRWFDLRRTTRPSITHSGLTKCYITKDDPGTCYRFRKKS